MGGPSRPAAPGASAPWWCAARGRWEDRTPRRRGPGDVGGGEGALSPRGAGRGGRRGLRGLWRPWRVSAGEAVRAERVFTPRAGGLPWASVPVLVPRVHSEWVDSG